MPYGNNIPPVIKERRVWWQEHLTYVPALHRDIREPLDFHLGLTSGEPMTLDDTATRFGITYDAASAVMSRAESTVRRWETLTLTDAPIWMGIGYEAFERTNIATIAEILEYTPAGLLALEHFVPNDLPRIEALLAARGWSLHQVTSGEM